MGQAGVGGSLRPVCSQLLSLLPLIAAVPPALSRRVLKRLEVSKHHAPRDDTPATCTLSVHLVQYRASAVDHAV